MANKYTYKTQNKRAEEDREGYDLSVRNAYGARTQPVVQSASGHSNTSGTFGGADKRDTASLDAINAQNAYDALQLAEYQSHPQQLLPLPDKPERTAAPAAEAAASGGGTYYAAPPAASAPVTADWMQYASAPAAPTALPAAAYDYGSAPEYVSPYQAMIDEALGAYLNRPAFAYDPQTDPQYAAYRKQYAREGQRATADTLGQYAAMTGGVPSSYAVTAAQQAGDYYAAQMADKIPELYQAAYQMYSDEGNRMLSGLNALRNAESDSYGRYLTKLGQFNTDRNVQLSLDQLAYERAQAEQDAIRERVGSYLSLGGSLSGLDPALITGSGLTAAELAAIENSYAQPVYYGGGGGGGGYSDSDTTAGTGGTVETMLGLGNDVSAYEYLISLGLSNAKTEQLWDLYEASKETSPYASGVPDYSGNRSGYENPEVTNANSESWIAVPGYGRLSWQELEHMVDNGEVTESFSKDGSKVSYSKNRR